MYSCPACGRSEVAELSRCPCGADLSILQNLNVVADAWFNRALAALAEGQPGKALEWLSACCAARPDDAIAMLAKAKVWAQLGHLEQSRCSLDRAAEIDSSMPGLADLAQALQEAQHSATTALPEAQQPGAECKAKAGRQQQGNRKRKAGASIRSSKRRMVDPQGKMPPPITTNGNLEAGERPEWPT